MIKVDQLRTISGGFELKDINFEIPSGDYGVLMGRTGSGKTTLLEAICGLKQVSKGRVYFGVRDVTDLPVKDRGIGFVPQESALFSSMTIREHLVFGPRTKRWDASQVEKIIDQLAEQLDLTELLDRRPKGLSGGERQRVALGRALAIKPEILCLDEPLNALDEQTHSEMTTLLKRVVKRSQITVLHITHSQWEANELADCLFRLESGRLIKSE